MTVALVACGRTKRAHPSPAQDLYTSALFQKSRAYAETVSDRWFIISAQHGLLDPGSVVAPYDRSLHDLDREERRAWATSVVRDVLADTPPSSEFVILAGAQYRADIVPALLEEGHRVSVPLAGKGIGEQLAWFTSGGASLSPTAKPAP